MQFAASRSGTLWWFRYLAPLTPGRIRREQKHHHACAMQDCSAVFEWKQLRMTQRVVEELLLCGCVVKPPAGEQAALQPRGTSTATLNWHFYNYSIILCDNISTCRAILRIFIATCVRPFCQCSPRIRSIKFNHDPRLVPQEARPPSPGGRPAEQLRPAGADLHRQHDGPGDGRLPAGAHRRGRGPDVGQRRSGWHEK